MPASFAESVVCCLGQIPRGRAATCGAIARALGDVRAARSVATWLVEHPQAKDGHRVVRSDGRPILEEADRRLAREGLRLRRGRVDPSRILPRLQPVPFLDGLREEQRRLAAQVIERDQHGSLERVAGVDVSYQGDETFAAAVSLSTEDFQVEEIAVVRGHAEFPYVPTYLAYREFPAIEAAVNRLTRRPDALLVDGHGRLHPAGFGIACYVGLRLDLPAIGIAKHPLSGTRLTGSRHEDALGVGIDGTTQGYAWRPAGRGRPIYVSVGHRFSLEGALNLVRTMTPRLHPEPIAIADRISREMKRSEKREKGAAR